MLDKVVDLLLNFLQIFQFWVVLDEYEEGVVLTLGRPRKHRFFGLWGSCEIGPGFHWKWPLCVDNVMYANVVPTTTKLGTQSLTTKDGVGIVVSGVVTWQIKNTKRMLLEVNEPIEALCDCSYSAIAKCIEHSTWEEICLDEFSDKLTRAVRSKALFWGIKVSDVTLADKVRTPSIRLITDHDKPSQQQA